MNFKWSHITLYIISAAIIATWVTSILSTKNKSIENINYSIESVEGARNLITTKEIRQRVHEIYDLEADRIRVGDLDLNELENTLSQDNRIYKTEIHLDAKREMHINVIQRRPVVRIIDKTGAQYYLDQEGAYVSKQDFKAVRVPVATGEIEAYSGDWQSKKGRIRDCYQIVQALKKDKFFTALVEQIHFEDDKVKMIPKVGSAAIVINDLTYLDQKLQNLKLFYETEMAHNNAWDKYDEIDISIKNQVIPRTTKP